MPAVKAGAIKVAASTNGQLQLFLFAQYPTLRCELALLYAYTILVKSGAVTRMAKKKSRKKVRASVSFDAERYAELGRIAKDKKVSVAWVVREAVEQYIGAQWPLLAERPKQKSAGR